MAVMFDACYIEPGMGDNPLVSPAVADIEMLRQPPTVILTAEYDSLRDEGELYANKLMKPVFPCVLLLGSAHGFTMTLGGRSLMWPEDTNAAAGCKMMMDALRYYIA